MGSIMWHPHESETSHASTLKFSLNEIKKGDKLMPVK